MTASPQTALPGAMPGNVPENAPQPADFRPVEWARDLLRTTRAGALGTLDRNTGHPVSTLTTVATDSDGSPVILISNLSSHTANLKADPRGSVLLARTGKGDPLAHPRLTVLGTFAKVEDEALRARLRGRFLARHPKSQLYVDFPDFSFWRMSVAAGHLNGGFARAADLAAADLLLDVGDAGDLMAAEASAIAHMNEDHADAVSLYATALAGEEPGPWRLSGTDPEGFDLTAGDRTARVLFPERVTSGDLLHKTLVRMVREARARQAG
ncbi:HugZ family protein [Phreatobacter sp.]|uniref:HugZ family pyridoxamine 5'-phosphate oxidase n=1 Tax=Phreatobacter sp. TaxID=1966341 RepID=UPI003F70E0DD